MRQLGKQERGQQVSSVPILKGEVAEGVMEAPGCVEMARNDAFGACGVASSLGVGETA